MLQRSYFDTITRRINEPRKFIQIIEGPRQVGKSTLIKQVLKNISSPWLHFAADNVPATRSAWISDCWTTARNKLQMEHLTELLLVIDEVQKLKNWGEVVKKEWDDDTFNDIPLKVVLLGSSRVRLEKGLSESLQGRFETIKMPNWSLREMQEAFGMTTDEYIYFGGYPGAADLRYDFDRWQEYISSSIVDATINNDILVDTVITKPALLRQTFELSSAYSGLQVSLTKMLGQLQDAGNTTTLTNYLELLNQCGMVCGLSKYAVDKARRRKSVPKYQVYNNALMSLYCEHDFAAAKADRKLWGRLYESAVGAHILNCAYTGRFKVYYWRDGDAEVDFVLVKDSIVVAVEVKSNHDKDTAGLHKFQDLFHPHRSVIVGDEGITIESFFGSDLKELFL
ncbi:MAG: ATP-binding protein [Paludibacteraceae bacterium]|nr:ATP-binding protein [Paludibacteraceae bacterium]